MSGNADRTPDRAPLASFVGLGGLAVAFFLYAYLAVAAPGWLHSAVLPLVWLVLAGLGCAWFLRRPRLVAALAVAAVLVWFAAVLVPAYAG